MPSTENRSAGGNILLVDDDPWILISLSRGLSINGFEVLACSSAGEAIPILNADWPSVVILDVAMPGMDGITFCTLIRGRFNVPILMLTARDAVEDRVAGLDAGADDYLVKPFALTELIARLHALQRRAKATAADRKQLSFAGIELDKETWTASRSGRQLSLTAIEFRLLETLLSRPGVVFTRETLLDRVWGSVEAGSSNLVDVHVANLRRKLEDGGSARAIETVRGVGYRLTKPE